MIEAIISAMLSLSRMIPNISVAATVAAEVYSLPILFSRQPIKYVAFDTVDVTRFLYFTQPVLC